MSRSMFDKVLIANRGEIACRIIGTCRSLGIRTVAIHTSVEGSPLHAELADESCVLPESATPAGSYLDAKAIVDIAARTGANAIHPGYGFLSESPALAERCAERSIAFVGPRSDVAHLMADKWQARKKMASLGVPVLPGASVRAEEEESVSAALKADRAAPDGQGDGRRRWDRYAGCGKRVAPAARTSPRELIRPTRLRQSRCLC